MLLFLLLRWIRADGLVKPGVDEFYESNCWLILSFTKGSPAADDTK